MQNLFNIKNEYLQLMQEIEECEGELTPEQEERLAMNIDDFQERMQAYIDMIHLAEGNIATAEAEIERINGYKIKNEKTIITLKKYITDGVNTFGTKQGKDKNKHLTVGMYTLSTRNSKSVEIDDIVANNNKQLEEYCTFICSDLDKESKNKIEKLLPTSLFKRKYDKKALKKALELQESANNEAQLEINIDKLEEQEVANKFNGVKLVSKESLYGLNGKKVKENNQTLLELE